MRSMQFCHENLQCIIYVFFRIAISQPLLTRWSSTFQMRRLYLKPFPTKNNKMQSGTFLALPDLPNFANKNFKLAVASFVVLVQNAKIPKALFGNQTSGTWLSGPDQFLRDYISVISELQHLSLLSTFQIRWKWNKKCTFSELPNWSYFLSFAFRWERLLQLKPCLENLQVPDINSLLLFNTGVPSQLYRNFSTISIFWRPLAKNWKQQTQQYQMFVLCLML